MPRRASAPLPFFHDWIRKGGLQQWLDQQIRDAEFRELWDIRYDEAADRLTGTMSDPAAGPEHFDYIVEHRHKEMIRRAVDDSRADLRAAVLAEPSPSSLKRLREIMLAEIDDLRSATTALPRRRQETIVGGLDEIEIELDKLTLHSQPDRAAKSTLNSGNPEWKANKLGDRESDLALFALYVSLLDEYPPRRLHEVSKGIKAELLEQMPEYGSVSTVGRRVKEVAKDITPTERHELALSTGVSEQALRSAAATLTSS